MNIWQQYSCFVIVCTDDIIGSKFTCKVSFVLSPCTCFQNKTEKFLGFLKLCFLYIYIYINIFLWFVQLFLIHNEKRKIKIIQNTEENMKWKVSNQMAKSKASTHQTNGYW